MSGDAPVVKRCTVCGETNVFRVPAHVIRRLNTTNCRPIQEIWPQASPAEHEQLKLGTHPGCQFAW